MGSLVNVAIRKGLLKGLVWCRLRQSANALRRLQHPESVVGDVTHGVGLMMKSDGTPWTRPKGYVTRPDAALRPRLQGGAEYPSKQGWNVCRLHGASGGPPSGEAHPNYKPCMRLSECVERRKEMNALIRQLRDIDVMD